MVNNNNNNSNCQSSQQGGNTVVISNRGNLTKGIVYKSVGRTWDSRRERTRGTHI